MDMLDIEQYMLTEYGLAPMASQRDTDPGDPDWWGWRLAYNARYRGAVIFAQADDECWEVAFCDDAWELPKFARFAQDDAGFAAMVALMVAFMEGTPDA